MDLDAGPPQWCCCWPSKVHPEPEQKYVEKANGNVDAQSEGRQLYSDRVVTGSIRSDADEVTALV